MAEITIPQKAKKKGGIIILGTHLTLILTIPQIITQIINTPIPIKI